MTRDDIKLMRLSRQHLLKKVDKLTAISDLCGYQAQIFKNSYHSARIRTATPLNKDTWGDGLVKSWTVRGTMHVFAEADMPLFIRRCATPDDVCDSSFYEYLCSHGHFIPPSRLKRFAHIITDGIADGICGRNELKELCRSQGMTETEEAHVFYPWGGIIYELAENGVIHSKASESKQYALSKPFVPMSPDEALMELVRRYFTNFGPSTLKDASYYMRIPQRQIFAALEHLNYLTTLCDGRAYHYIDNSFAENVAMPKCIFLAGFDQLMLGYEKSENPFLDSKHLRGIYNLAGIVFPALLIDGSVTGRWKEDGRRILVTPFTQITAKQKKCICSLADEYWPGKPLVIE